MGILKDELDLDDMEQIYIEKVLRDELQRVENRIQRNKKLYNLKSKGDDDDDVDLSKYVDKIDLEYKHREALQKTLSFFEPNATWKEEGEAI